MGIYGEKKNAGISEKFYGKVFRKVLQKVYGGNFTKKGLTGEMGNQV